MKTVKFFSTKNSDGSASAIKCTLNGEEVEDMFDYRLFPDEDAAFEFCKVKNEYHNGKRVRA